ncbi:MAG TPA: flagellar protein FlgN [Lachnospiraceae bacterium]|nr:flagellar protein FlgN [Lachnospiraceae bacterium]
MASLMENLIDVLDKENSEYEILLALSTRKTPIIVKGDLAELEKITDEEQIVVSHINHLEKTREEIINDIASVINKDVLTLKLSNIIQMLESRPVEKKKLALVHDKLQFTIKNMVRVNEQNKQLIMNSLEMIEFDLNVIQAMNTAPESANYNKGAINVGSSLGNNKGGFDAKQ